MIHNNIEEYKNLKPSAYPFLKLIQFSRKLSRRKSYTYDVELILSKDSSFTEENIRINCINASDIKVGRIEGVLALLVKIESIREKQLEDCNYRIHEQEESAFSFNCEEFFIDLMPLSR